LHVKNYFYAEARSLIPNTINEFPSYSFLISDLHAHIIDIPFVLLFIGLFISFILNKDLLKKKYFLLITTLSLGVLGATNSWDYLIYAPLLFLGILLVFYFNETVGIWKKIRKSILLSAFIGIISLLLFVFFYLNFKPASSGFGFTKDFLGLLPILRMFGYYVFGGIALSVYFLIKRQFTEKDRLIILMFLYGAFLVFLPNIVFLKDIYYKANPSFFRANTVFKLWYQAWIILSLITPYAFYKLFTNLRKSKKYIALISFLIIFLFITFWIFKYPVISVRYVIGTKYIYKGLDGSAYLRESDSWNLVTIDWINTNVKGQPVLLEAWGKPYTKDSLITSYTGLPTPVGWVEHEFGWRDNWPVISDRMVDIDTMYTGSSEKEVLGVVKKYNVRYAVITDLEKSKYGANAGEMLRIISDFSIVSGNSELLRIRPY
jgi:uncharacterized membrane protein